jgi:GxxExxY protein
MIDDEWLDSLTENVLSAVFEVSDTLGAGFTDKVYQRALLRELTARGIRANAEVSFKVMYKGKSVGEFFADLLVEDALVLKLKSAERLTNEHSAQALNCLKASGRTACLLLNFQKPKAEWKRIVPWYLQGPEQSRDSYGAVADRAPNRGPGAEAGARGGLSAPRPPTPGPQPLTSPRP